MNRRLQQFLDIEQLSPSRLADILGIQRSGISHILSGRNKPGFDFIYKMLKKFPQINAEWLITGNGKPYKDMNGETAEENTPILPREQEEDMPIFDMDETVAEENQPQTPAKRLVRATLFYSDGSFEELFPSK